MSGSRKTKLEARDRQFDSELGRSGISGPDFIHLSILPLIRIRLLFFFAVPIIFSRNRLFIMESIELIRPSAQWVESYRAQRILTPFASNASLISRASEVL